jgi:hypothetical protein
MVSTQTGNDLLGKLVYFSVGELKVSKQELENLFLKNNLSLSQYQPGDIRPSDAMRRATSTIRNRKIEILYNGKMVKAVLDVTESNTPDYAYRYIARKIIDDNNKEVKYDQISTFIFDKSNNQLTWTSVDLSFLLEYPYDKVLGDVENLYDEWTKYHTKDTVRNIMLRIINTCMPALVKSIEGEDSIAKFIPIAYSNVLENMKNILMDLRQYQTSTSNCGIQFIDLYDSQNNRSMIQKSIENDVKKKVDLLVSDLTETLSKNGNISSKKMTILSNRLKSTKREVAHYASLLKTTLGILDKQIETAFERIGEVPEGDIN